MNIVRNNIMPSPFYIIFNFVETTMDYIYQEFADIHRIYCQANGYEAQTLYHERFPGRRLSNHFTFNSFDRRLKEISSFTTSSACMGIPKTKQIVMGRFGAATSRSTRKMSADISVRYSMVWSILC